MNVQHTLAIAPVGWLLLVPPVTPGTREVNKSAPLSEWTRRRSFPHSEGCENAKYQLRKQALAVQAEQAMGKTRQIDPEEFCAPCNAQCVAEDDPRLKEK